MKQKYTLIAWLGLIGTSCSNQDLEEKYTDVGQVQVIAMDRHRVAAIHAPGGIAPMRYIDDSSRIRLRPVAHPYPYQSITLDGGVAAHHRALRRMRQTRRAHA